MSEAFGAEEEEECGRGARAGAGAAARRFPVFDSASSSSSSTDTHSMASVEGLFRKVRFWYPSSSFVGLSPKTPARFLFLSFFRGKIIR